MSVTQRVIGYLGKATASGREIIDTDTPQIILPEPHHSIHEGISYLASYSQLKGDTETIELRVESTDVDKRAHLVLGFESALAATVEVWTSTTKTDVPGNRIAALNRDLNESDNSTLLICHTPGGSQAGAADLTRYIGAATVSGRGDVGGSANSRGEILLPPQGAVLIKMTSRAASNALTILLDWYEHEH